MWLCRPHLSSGVEAKQNEIEKTVWRLSEEDFLKIRLIYLHYMQHRCTHSSPNTEWGWPHTVRICWLAWNYQLSHFPSLKYFDFHLGIHVAWKELTPHLSPGVWRCIWLTFDSGPELWPTLVWWGFVLGLLLMLPEHRDQLCLWELYIMNMQPEIAIDGLGRNPAWGGNHKKSQKFRVAKRIEAVVLITW